MAPQGGEGSLVPSKGRNRIPMTIIQELFRELKTPLYKNAIYLTMNTVIGSGLAFFFWIIVARIYSPYEVGLAAAIIPIVILIGLLSRFGFETGLIRFLPSSGQTSNAMINSCFTISSVAAVLVSILFLLGLGIWSPELAFIRENWLFSSSFIVFSIGFTLYPMMNQVFVARRDTRFVLASTLISGLRMILPVFFIFLFGAFGIFASWGVALLIALTIGLFVFIPIANPGYRPFPTMKRNLIGRMLRFSVANYVPGIFSALPASLLPLMIINNLGAENVAYYYIAFTIAGLLFTIAGAFCLSLFAEGSHDEKKLGISIRRALRFLFALLIPAIIVIFLFGRYFLLLFGNDYSQQGLVLLQIFALSSVFVAINGIFYTSMQVQKRLRLIIAIPIFIAFAVVGFSYVFLLSFGLIGVAIGWTLSQGIVTVGIVAYYLRQKLYKTKPVPSTYS